MARIGVWGLGWYVRWQAGREGRAEGRQGKPPNDQQEAPQYELTVKNEIEKINYAIVDRWHKLDDRLFREYCAAEKERQNTEAEIQRLQPQCQQLGNTFNQMAGQIESTGGLIYLNKPAYIAIILLLGVLEVPVNYSVMQILGLDPLYTALATAGPAAVLMFGAHFTGMALKGGKERFIWLPRLAILVTALTLILLIGIAYLREEFIAQFGERALGVRLNRTVITITFAAINAVLLVLATMASYLAHDEMIEKYLKAREEFARCQARLLQARRRLDQLSVRLADLRARRVKLFEEHRAMESQFKNEGQVLMSLYRKANLRARPDAALPRWAKELPKIDLYMPSTISWDCAEQKQPAVGIGAEAASPGPPA
jgi:hypothetical protein